MLWAWFFPNCECIDYLDYGGRLSRNCWKVSRGKGGRRRGKERRGRGRWPGREGWREEERRGKGEVAGEGRRKRHGC